MNIFLRLRHWQLFLLLGFFPMVSQIVFVETIGFDKTLKLVALVNLLPGVIFLSWLYALGINLHKKLPASVKMNLVKFKFFLALTLAYILFINTVPERITLKNFFIPVHLFSVFGIFYCMYFIAKELKAAEWQKPVTSNDFGREFVLFCFFIIGIWIIQPRINRLFKGGDTETVNLDN